MKFHRKDTELPDDYITLYCESFPHAERRGWKTNADAKQWICSHKNCHVYLIRFESRFVGFLNCWNLYTPHREILYIEHFAISPGQRGNGLGADVLKEIISTSKIGIILEVEPPVDEMTRRRIAFYERNGLKLHTNLPYQQPPYSTDRQPVVLKIMSSPEIPAQEIASHIIPELYRTVYNQP